MIRHGVNNIVAVAVVIPAVFGNSREGATRRVLGSSPLVYLGVISYGFYLWHWAVLKQILDFRLAGTIGSISPWAWFGLGFLGALVLGSLSWYLVERPALSLKRLVPHRRRKDSPEALPEPAPATPTAAPPTT
jgi:peptidoglycan/LPS O-acetylase OafA/YrhL